MALSKMSNTEILKMKTKNGVRFGKELREKEFLFDKEWLNLNHGEQLQSSLLLLPLLVISAEQFAWATFSKCLLLVIAFFLHSDWASTICCLCMSETYLLLLLA